MTDTGWTAGEIAWAVLAGSVSAREIAEAALRRLEVIDGELRAFRQVWRDDARRMAAEVDGQVAGGARPPMAGVPIGVKAWEGPRSVQVRRLVEAGCVPIGATAVPLAGTQWQTWGHTERGPTVNPWRPDRSAGGSSAGSAAAVATAIVPLATAVDGAGSARIPAAWCGVVGLKLTNGSVPVRDRYGVVAAGAIVRDVSDLGLYLDAVLPRERPRGTPAADGWLPVAAVSATLGFADTDPEVEAVAAAATARLAAAGAFTRGQTAVELLDPELAWYAARRPAGNSSAQAMDTHRVVDTNNARLSGLFEVVDLLVTPTTPTPPHGHAGPGERMNTALTWAFNLSGHPALTIPAGFTSDGCPVGLQLVARHGEEATLVRVAATAQRTLPWDPPPLFGGDSEAHT